MENIEAIVDLPEALKQTSALTKDWEGAIKRLLAGRKYESALKLLDSIIESEPPPLFGEDRAFFNARRAALRVRTNILVELGRPSDALASACLESLLSPDINDTIERRNYLLAELGLARGHRAPLTEETTTCRWAGVPGLHTVKTKLLRDVVSPIRAGSLLPEYGVRPPAGILFYGPPGCGKTSIARAIAAEIGYSLSEVTLGDLARANRNEITLAVNQLFNQAYGAGKTVLFFDEFDALVPERVSSDAITTSVNDFLVHLDTCAKREVLVVATTSRIDRIDFAVLRPGRMDHLYHVTLPNFAERIEIFECHLGTRPRAKLELNVLAEEAEGLTPAQIELTVQQAARVACANSRLIEQADLSRAMSGMMRVKRSRMDLSVEVAQLSDRIH